MTILAIEMALLLLATYIVGCAAGCWLRRMTRRRTAKA